MSESAIFLAYFAVWLAAAILIVVNRKQPPLRKLRFNRIGTLVVGVAMAGAVLAASGWRGWPVALGILAFTAVLLIMTTVCTGCGRIAQLLPGQERFCQRCGHKLGFPSRG